MNRKIRFWGGSIGIGLLILGIVWGSSPSQNQVNFKHVTQLRGQHPQSQKAVKQLQLDYQKRVQQRPDLTVNEISRQPQRDDFQTERNFVILKSQGTMPLKELMTTVNAYGLKNPGEPVGDWRIQFKYDQTLMQAGYLKYLDAIRLYNRYLIKHHMYDYSYSEMLLHLSRRDAIEQAAINALKTDAAKTQTDFDTFDPAQSILSVGTKSTPITLQYDEFATIKDLVQALNRNHYLNDGRMIMDWRKQYNWDQIHLAKTYLTTIVSDKRAVMFKELDNLNFNGGNFTPDQLQAAWRQYQKLKRD